MTMSKSTSYWLLVSICIAFTYQRVHHNLSTSDILSFSVLEFTFVWVCCSCLTCTTSLASFLPTSKYTLQKTFHSRFLHKDLNCLYHQHLRFSHWLVFRLSCSISYPLLDEIPEYAGIFLWVFTCSLVQFATAFCFPLLFPYLGRSAHSAALSWPSSSQVFKKLEARGIHTSICGSGANEHERPKL